MYYLTLNILTANLISNNLKIAYTDLLVKMSWHDIFHTAETGAKAQYRCHG